MKRKADLFCGCETVWMGAFSTYKKFCKRHRKIEVPRPVKRGKGGGRR